jgi:IS30 family transposase
MTKGPVENRTGIIHKLLTKKTDLKFLSEEQICKVERNLNNRLIRKFIYITANKVQCEKIALIT